MRVGILFILVLLALAALFAYIRLAPSDPARWHADPFTAQRPDGNGWLVRPEGGNAAGAVHTCAPETLLASVDRIALDTPRTRHLAGSLAEGQITYISRSRVLGFPDYTTVSAMGVDDGSTLGIFARQRFGAKDMGVNRTRVETWMSRLESEPDCPVSP